MPAAAVMQPYLFPYIGYFHLIQAVDFFVILDDVQMPTRGFVNRNALLVEGVRKWFTLPIHKDHRGTPLARRQYMLSDAWCNKTMGMIRHNYASETREPAMRLVANLQPSMQSDQSVIAVNRSLLLLTLDAIGIPHPTVLYSSSVAPKAEDSTKRFIQICTELGATEYVNLPGGRSLYRHSRFQDAGLRLGFIESNAEPYPQRSERFVPWLSILDLIGNTTMENRSAALSAFRVDFGHDSGTSSIGGI